MARSGAEGGTGGRPGGWGRWLAVAGGALLLLALSEVLWLWQTWPVRELLQLPVAGATLR